MAVINTPEKLVWPVKSWTLEVSQRPEDIAKRDHNKYSKEALRETMEEYHDRFVPKKFKRGNRSRYGYHARSRKYVRYKQRVFKRTPVDMVFSGASRDSMTRIFRLTLGGSAIKGTQRANLILRFPFLKSGRLRKAKVTDSARTRASRDNVRVMVQEMQRFADDEPQWIGEQYAKHYFRRVEAHRRRRKRIRIT